jgi:hypothetical protein
MTAHCVRCGMAFMALTELAALQAWLTHTERAHVPGRAQ